MEIRNIDDKTKMNEPMPIQKVSMPRTSSTYYTPTGQFRNLILRAINLNQKAGEAEDYKQPQLGIIGSPSRVGPTPAPQSNEEKVE